MYAQRKRWPKGTWMKLHNGMILRGLMDKKGLSNADVAMASGVGRTFISALVNGRKTSCTPEVAELIARRLDVPRELIFDERTSAGSGSSAKQTRKTKAAA